jgi:hypothetical protein
LNDAGGDFQQPQPQRRKLGFRQIALRWNGVSDAKHQPMGGGVQDKTHLIGERGAAGCAVGGELGFVRLDEVFRLSEEAVVNL